MVSYHHKNEKHVYTGVNQRLINPYPDSIRIELPAHNVLIVVEAKRFHQGISALDDLPSLLNEWQDLIKNSHEQTEKCASHKVHISTDLNGFTKVSIHEENDNLTQLLIKEKQLVQLLTPGWEIYYQSENYKLYLYAENIESLGKILPADFEIVKSRLNESKTFSVARKSVKSRFIVKNGTIEHQDIKYYHPLDMVSLSASTGLGVIRNKIYPELTGSLGFYLADRFNRHSHRIELSYASMYFADLRPESTYSNNISSFLSLSYSKNLGGKGQRPIWLGLGAGLKVQEAGDFDFFTGKTMKIFLITDPGSAKFSVVPELYLTDDFKKSVFGVKLHYRF